MNNIFKYSTVFFIAVSAVFAILYFTKPEKVCPECPKVASRVTLVHDTVTVHDTIHPGRIRLTKFVKSIPDKPLPAKDCDSINTLFNSQFSYEVPFEDSLSKILMKVTVSQNLITAADVSISHFITSRIDSIIQYIDRPVERTCFTFGLAVGQNVSAANLGFRSKKLHVSAGYNFQNKERFTNGLLINANYDLRK